MKYFTLEEFKRSRTADLQGIDNTIPVATRENIERLVREVLDPLRQAWGRPLIVNSGYRCPQLNAAVGGSRTSHHLRGMAADITTGNAVDNRKLFQLVQDLHLPYTQLIGESNFTWLHISHDPADIRRQVLLR